MNSLSWRIDTVIAIAMYILLGVLVTLLLTLLIMPLIWKRAVRLTEKRVLAEMPLSYSELQAEKDMQRAELAVEMRKLEVTADQRFEELANSSMKIDRLKNTIEKRDETISERLADIAELQEELQAQKQATASTQESLSASEQALKDATDTIKSLEVEKDSLQTDHVHLMTSFNEQKVDGVAQMARNEGLREEVYELTMRLKQEKAKRLETDGLLSQKTSESARFTERMNRLQDRIDGLQGELADKDTELEILAKQLERAIRLQSEKETDSGKLLEDAQTRRLEAEAKIASLAMQLENRHASGGENLSTVIEGLQREKMDLETQLAQMQSAHSDLKRQIADMHSERKAEAANTALSPRELLLRKEIKTIAARLSDHVTKEEEEKSALNDQLSQTGGDAVLPSEPKSEPESATLSEVTQSGLPKPAGNDPWSQIFSVTDQIRELENGAPDKDAQ